MARYTLPTFKRRVKDTIPLLLGLGLDLSKAVAITYTSPTGDQRAIDLQSLDEECSPGAYRFECPDPAHIGGPPLVIEGDFLVVRGDEDVGGGAMGLARAAGSMSASQAAEVQRAHRRLAEEEERSARFKAERNMIDDALQATRAELAAAQRRIADLEAASGLEDLGEALAPLATPYLEKLFEALGIDPNDEEAAARAAATAFVVEVVREEPDAQAIVMSRGGGDALRALGMGGEST